MDEEVAVENLPPFDQNPTLSEQLTQLHRNGIESQLREVSKSIGHVTVSLARQEEWRESVTERLLKLDTLSKDVSEIKDLANRYKGGLYAVLGLGAALSGISFFWDKIISKLH